MQINRKNTLKSDSGIVPANAATSMINNPKLSQYVVKSLGECKLLLNFAFSVETVH